MLFSIKFNWDNEISQEFVDVKVSTKLATAYNSATCDLVNRDSKVMLPFFSQAAATTLVENLALFYLLTNILRKAVNANSGGSETILNALFAILLVPNIKLF